MKPGTKMTGLVLEEDHSGYSGERIRKWQVWKKGNQLGGIALDLDKDSDHLN